MPLPFTCPALGAGAGWSLCVPPLQGKASMRKPWLGKHTGTVPSEQRKKHGVQGADFGDIAAFTPECPHRHPRAPLHHLHITNVRRAVNSISCVSQCKVQFEIAEPCFKPARPA